LFILTGSATPAYDEYRHNGAGRFASLILRTLSLQEAGRSEMKIEIFELSKPEFKVIACSSNTSFADMISYITKGG
jgi:hypothetical protein